MVVHRTRESSSSLVSKRFPAVRKLSSRTNEQNGYRDSITRVLERSSVDDAVRCG